MATQKEQKGPGGRPLIFETPEELQAAIDSYFETCDRETIAVFHKQLDRKTGSPVTMDVSKPYTVEGLAIHLGVHRETILNYRDRPEFFDIIMRAREKITQSKIERALIGAYDPRFTVFDLINNSGYKNEKSVDHTSGGEPSKQIIIE